MGYIIVCYANLSGSSLSGMPMWDGTHIRFNSLLGCEGFVYFVF